LAPAGQTILCLDVGNTDIYGGICRDREVIMEFRKSNSLKPTADEFGVFVIQLLNSHGLDAAAIDAVAIASVVPDCNEVLIEASLRYLGKTPLLLQAGVKTGLKIRTTNPAEVGADRIANAIAAVERFPARNRIIIDMGTATTFCVVDAKDCYYGGVIAAGMGLSMRALARNTAKLPFVELGQPEQCLGRTTVESIRSGLYFGHLGLLRECTYRLASEAFGGEEPTVIGTGGHARLFADSGIFDAYLPGLVLQGLCRAVELNS
jgi:type III pantothenate kinase